MSQVSALWMLFMAFFLLRLFGQGLTDAQSPATTTLAVTTAVTQLLAGLLADRVRLNWLVSLGVSFMIGALLVLVNATTPWMAHTYALLLGVTQELLGIVGGILWVRYYGRVHLGKIRGNVFTAGVAGSSLDPFIMGLLYDNFSSYQLSLWIFIGLLAPLVVAAFWATEPDGGEKG
jgi:MFS family permease